jgi:hypothetical protein
VQALRLAKGSSGEYRLRMPTALILSQFGYAKMPVTLPLEVYVDGKRVGELLSQLSHSEMLFML